MSVKEWPVEVPLVLTDLVGPETITRGLVSDPDEYRFRQPSREQLAACQDLINDLPPDGAEVAIRSVADYLHAVYTQYDGYWDRERGYGLCVMRRRWVGKGGIRAERGDFVLARFDVEGRSWRSKYGESEAWTFFSVRGGCNCLAETEDLRIL